MNALGIIALGLFAFCAAAPSVPLLVLDLIDLHAVHGEATLDAASCARERARERALHRGS